MRCGISAITILSSVTTGLAWDGTDSQTGAGVEIGKGNLVRSGRDIEVLDHATREYRNVTVQDINRRGNIVEVEVYDP